jgi:uncharacterized Zn-binding protein involved in type VI secretion
VPATVNANQMALTHASSSGINSIFPDTCKTPTPGGPVPIPYPNIAQSSDTADGSSTVKVDGNPIMLKGSNYKMSAGDEAGSAMGVVSNKIKGKAEPVNYSFDVKVDGKNVFRLTDMMLQNVGTPNTPPGTNVEPPVLGKTLSSEECKKTQEKAEEQAAEGTSWGESGVVGPHKGPIQDAATAFNAVIYIRQTKEVCGKWILDKHQPKPHSCMSGTTIKATDVTLVQNFLNREHERGEAIFIHPRASNYGYTYDAGDYVGIVGLKVADDMIKPLRGGGSQTISYEGKWMTGDYDLFEVLILGRNCDKVKGDRFAALKKHINKGCSWDAIQHPPQAQWVPSPKEQAEGVKAMNMNHLVRDACSGALPVTHKENWHPDRGGMAVLDKPLTVVSGKGAVTLKDEEEVKDALVCQECNK